MGFSRIWNVCWFFMELSHYLFSGHLDEGERIVDIAHRHPFIYFKASFKTFFFGMVLPIVFFLFFPKAVLIWAIWFGAGILGMLYHFMDWYFDAWLLTTAGVVDIEKNGLFERNSTRVEYHMIEGISYEIKGFWPTILNFGDVTIDKMGTSTSVHLKDGASPKKIERKIMKYQEEFVEEKSIRDHNALKNMLADMIAYHIQNKKIDSPKNKK